MSFGRFREAEPDPEAEPDVRFSVYGEPVPVGEVVECNSEATWSEWDRWSEVGCRE